MAESSEHINGIEELDNIIMNLFSMDKTTEGAAIHRSSADCQNRADSALSNLIDSRIQTKALPLALRKRLMYERAVIERNIA